MKLSTFCIYSDICVSLCDKTAKTEEICKGLSILFTALYSSPPKVTGILHILSRKAENTPVIAAEVGHDVLVLAFLHHGNLLLDGRDVITFADRHLSQCLFSTASLNPKRSSYKISKITDE